MALPANRISREFDKFQEVTPGEVAVKTLAVDDRFVLVSMDAVADWTVLNAASTGLAVDVDHKEGQYSIEFDKAADAALTTAGVYSSPSSLNVSRYSQGKLRYWINLSALTNVAKVSLEIGTSTSHCNVYETDDSALVTGWQELVYDAALPTSVTGNGCIWGDVDYISIFVTFDAAGDTLADVRVDALTAYNPLHVSITPSAGQDVKVLTATGAVAMSTTTGIVGEFQISQIAVHFSAAPTTSESFVVTLDANAGAAYDTVLFSNNPSLSAATDIAYVPDQTLRFVSGDQIACTFTNTDTRTYGLSIYYTAI